MWLVVVWEKPPPNFCGKHQFLPRVLISCVQSSSLSTGMDTIWDLKINNSRSTSPSVLSVPRQRWQIHEGMNEIAISSQFPPAFPQGLLRRTLPFLWLPAVCVARKAIQGQTSTLKTVYNRRNTLSAVDAWRSFTFLYVASSHRSAVKTALRISIWPSVQPAFLLFCGLLPLVIWDHSSTLPLALALNRSPRVTSSGQMVSPE